MSKHSPHLALLGHVPYVTHGRAPLPLNSYCVYLLWCLCLFNALWFLLRIFTVYYIILFSEYSIFNFFICGGCLSCPLTTLDGFPPRSLLFYLFNVMPGFCTMWIWHQLGHTRSIQKQELGSCWDGRPFGHNRHGLKSGGLLCPFPWGAGSPSNIMWPGPRSTSVPKWHLADHLCYAKRR